MDCYSRKNEILPLFFAPSTLIGVWIAMKWESKLFRWNGNLLFRWNGNPNSTAEKTNWNYLVKCNTGFRRFRCSVKRRRQAKDSAREVSARSMLKQLMKTHCAVMNWCRCVYVPLVTVLCVVDVCTAVSRVRWAENFADQPGRTP